MPPSPSEPAVRRSAPWRVPLMLLAVCVVSCLIVYTALHPVRLLSQASYIGKAPQSLQNGDDPVPVVDSCPCQNISGNAIDSGASSFPDGALLSDGRRRVVLAIPDSPANGRSKDKTATGRLILFSADAPGQKGPFVGVTPPDMRSLIGITADHRVGGASVAPVPVGVAITAAPAKAAEAPAEIALFRFGIMENRSPVERFIIHAPAIGAVREMALSPTGDRLLWVIRYTRRPYSAVAWAASHVPLLNRYATTRSAITVWTTDLLGRQPVRIGDEASAAAVAPAGQKTIPLPAHFAWMPDRRRIRFVYGRSFFAVNDPGS